MTTPTTTVGTTGREAIEAARRADVRWLVAWVVYVLIGILAAQRYSGPRPHSASEVEGVSAGRARETLSLLLGEEERVHRAGRPENEHVRVRLLGQLDELGLQTWVLPFRLSDRKREIMQPVSEPANIVARIAGEPRGRPVVVATHYDSAKDGPGAGDAGQCVAAILETARVLKGQPLRYETWLLLTDAEEFGLWGSQDFIEQGNFPWGEDKPIVISFDARGDRGASLLYETHEDNLRAMQLAAGAIAAPRVSTSLMVNVYKRLPNGTDFTTYRKAGWCGWNFAVVAGADRYHTADDTLANLSSRSLQHFAGHAYGLLRALDQLTSDQLRELDRSQPAVFFDVLGLFLVVYPEWGNWLHLALVALALGGFCFVPGSMRPRVLGVIWAVLAAVVLLAISYGIGWSIVRGLQSADMLPRNFVRHYEWLMLLFPLAASACVFGLGRVVCLVCRRDELVIGVGLLYWFLGLGASEFLPGGAYLFLWPATFLVVGGWLSRLAATRALQLEDDGQRVWLIPLAWCLLPAILYAPTYVLLAQTLGPRAGMVITAAVSLMLLPTWIPFKRTARLRG